MNRRERFVLVCFAFYGSCLACKTSSSAESHASAQVEQQIDATGKETVTETVRTGPETVTTTISEYGPGLVAGGGVAPPPEGYEPPSPTEAPRANPAVPTLSQRRVLVKRTVTVDQRSQAVQESRTEASGATETKTEVKAQQEAQTAHSAAPSGILGGLLSMWPLLLIGALAAAGWIAWRVLRSRVI